jgi:short subunit dehydrogenase-like uncharacterized protein
MTATARARADRDTPYDVVLYGASGFVGRQTVQYFARHAPEGVRWAIAGRDRRKLEGVREECGARVDVLVADGRDRQAIDAIVSRTRVILTTAGPFALHGDALVDACVRLGTDYVDITGETPWVRTVIDRHHARAAADGTRIVPSCGFDSVPSDIGTLLVVQHLQRTFGVPCERVNAFFRLSGGLNGGTLATTLGLFEAAPREQLADPFLLDPPERRGRPHAERHRDPRGPMLHADVDAWVGPFFMGPINTRVVRRSAALREGWHEPYGSDFAYQEYQQFDEPVAALRAIGMVAAAAVGVAALRQPQLRSLVRRLGPRPGHGPTAQAIADGWYVGEFVGTAAGGAQARGTIRHGGDPANAGTVTCVCESALGLALQRDELPGGPTRGGVLTPATALGDVLAARLRRAGVTIDLRP